ncbi:MAG TPA: allantoicase [Catenuloplanes sp.]|jgi:allantoicase
MTDFTALPDLAARSLGGGVVMADDEFFAAADNLVNPQPPVFRPHTFGPKGQVYDGWETRRRRTPGTDTVVVRLGAPGVVHGVIVDTAFFTGNYPPHAWVDGCAVDGYPGPAELLGADWFPLVPRRGLAGDTRTPFPVDVPRRCTHVRLTIDPDGGVARLRVHGEVVADPRLLPAVFDLAALEHGGRVDGCSNMFYGSPQNLIAPGLAWVMGDGWETARRRDDGNDWVLIRLAAGGTIDLVDLDTSHFKGNAPARATLRGVDARAADPGDPGSWFDLLPSTSLQPDTRHRFVVSVARAVSQVRLDVFPDGGMARLRLLGRPDDEGHAALVRRWREASDDEPGAR